MRKHATVIYEAASSARLGRGTGTCRCMSLHLLAAYRIQLSGLYYDEVLFANAAQSDHRFSDLRADRDYASAGGPHLFLDLLLQDLPTRGVG
jgi:hypothetical protein